MSDFFENFYKDMAAIRESHKNMADYLEKLLSEPNMKVPKVGDSAIVAVGMLNRGHLWIRKECTVVETTGTSVKVRGDSYGQPWEEWIDPILILDVLEKSPSVEKNPE